MGFTTADTDVIPGIPALSESNRDKATHREMINSMSGMKV